MCGICGRVQLGKNLEAIDKEVIRRMTDALRHRGPDDEGLYLSKYRGFSTEAEAALGHSRLSIIDLSNAGHQPMSNEDETIWVVCNGEIYNFIELRKDLENKGHRFKSHCDTEVIIHLYE